MFNRSIVAGLGAALVLALGLAQPAAAQANPDQPGRVATETGKGSIRGESVLPGRIGGDRQDRANQRQAARRPAAPAVVDPAVIRAEAQAVAAVAASGCTVTEAVKLGVTAEQQGIYEAACAAGPGYILVASTPPQAVDCVLLAGQAETQRARDPAAAPGPQCALPANTNVLGVIAGYARAASIDCDVDQGASIGKSAEGNYVYEVGCRDGDGYWLEQTGATWTKTECLQIVSQSATCRFTTPAEQAATLKTRLAGSPAAACDVQQARFMGTNANGAFYETKCAAGDGYIARFDAQGAVSQTYPCAEAAHIGGGCTLGSAAAVAAAPKE